MANIKDKIQQIRQAIFGKDVRESIASGIEEINKEVENNSTKQASVENRQDAVEKQFDEQIKNMTLQDPSSAELVAARTNSGGQTYDTVGKRLNEVDTQLADIVQQELPLKTDKTYVNAQLDCKRDKATPIDDIDITQNLRNMITGTTPVNNAIPATGSVKEIMLTNDMNNRILRNKYPFFNESTVDITSTKKYIDLLLAIIDVKLTGNVDKTKTYFISSFSRNSATTRYRIDITDSTGLKVCGGDSTFEVVENTGGVTIVNLPEFVTNTIPSGITCELKIDYSKIMDGINYYGNGIDCTPERYTFSSLVMDKANIYVLDAKTDNINLVNEQTFKCFERFKNGDINTNNYELAKIYSAIQYIKIVGSDATKPHKLRAISRNYGTVGDAINRWGWRFIISRKDGMSWVDILDTGKGFEITENVGVTEVTYTNGTVQATMRINYNLLPDNYAKTLDTADPLFIIKKECILTDSAVSTTIQPKKNLVAYNPSIPSIDVYSKYGDNNDIKFTFEKFSVNQLFAFHLINKNVNLETEPKEFTGGTIINADLTDWIGPYYVKAVNNGDGGLKARTGGCHGSNGDAETGFATGITDKIELFCDGVRKTSSTTLKCNKVDIYVKNRIMAYNTKTIPRYVLEEKVHYHIEGSKIDVKVEIRPLEAIVIEDYYGQQAVNRYYDNVFYIQGQYDAPQITLNTASDSGQKKDYYVTEAILSKSGTSETMLMTMDNTRGLGVRDLLPDIKPCIRSTEVEKTYMWVIYDNATQFTTNEIKYWIGTYEFRNAQ